MEVKVSTQNPVGEKLVGIETTPATTREKYATVLLVHGFGATKHDGGLFDDLAKILSDAGMLIYRFDFSGRGESDGDYSETSLSKLKSDLSSILEFVRSQAKVDTTRIGILAQSLGTATTVTLEPDIACLVLMGSISHPHEVFKQLFGAGYNPAGVSVRKKTDLLKRALSQPTEVLKRLASTEFLRKKSAPATTVKQQFWSDFDNHDLLKSIKNMKCPILFIHGSADPIVPVSEMEDYFQQANEPKEKVIIQGADHGLRPHRDKAYELAKDWFSKYLS